jgi:hypothetical protein
MTSMSRLRTTFVTGACNRRCFFLHLYAGATSPAAEPKMTIGCKIRVTPQNDMLRLEAVANGRGAATGTYRFEILKQSSTGTSQNVQSGAFRTGCRSGCHTDHSCSGRVCPRHITEPRLIPGLKGIRERFMRLALKFIAAYLAILILIQPGAFAEGAFVAAGDRGLPGTSSPPGRAESDVAGGAPNWTAPDRQPAGCAELAAPASGGNYAGTLEIGAYNKVFPGPVRRRTMFPTSASSRATPTASASCRPATI